MFGCEFIRMSTSKKNLKSVTLVFNTNINKLVFIRTRESKSVISIEHEKMNGFY